MMAKRRQSGSSRARQGKPQYVTGPQLEEERRQQAMQRQRQYAQSGLEQQAERLQAERSPHGDWTGVGGPPGSDAAERSRMIHAKAWLQRQLTEQERAKEGLPRGVSKEEKL